ncbi:PrgI family protein [Alkalibaculum bacchi]|uniref:PrgI family protein n=1 Tax=Alkalibaculum bacchi TaxID=645887 RepID=UPI0026F10D2C|nr:PrgI family protein [Alkalibaculum bacchi]
MAYVPVPKDLSKVKTKVALGLTKRQLICFSAAAAIGVPIFFLTKGFIGNSPAVLVMILFMLPAFFVAMYEKDGQPAEKIIKNILRARFFFPQTRPYKTENLYSYIEKEGRLFASKDKKAKPAGSTPAKKHSVSKGKQKRP